MTQNVNTGMSERDNSGQIRLLIVDDESDYLEESSHYYRLCGMQVKTATSAESALRLLSENRFDVILTDLVMPRMNGINLLRSLKDIHAISEVIVLTGHGTVETAIEAMQNGAFSYLQKGTNVDRVAMEIKKAAQTSKLKYENYLLKHNDQQKWEAFTEFTSPLMNEVFSKLATAAKSDAAILLLGESGVGKEVAANYVHLQSQRSERAFIKLHCASYSQGLLESELFGHEKGAFTGAVKTREGRFELADGGTIFIDEISTMPLDSQVRLLRVLQEKKVERVGGNRVINVDFRLISASNEDLLELSNKGLFRKDLFYRLDVISITIPALRDMKEDIPALVRFFLDKHGQSCGKPIGQIADIALTKLLAYQWPGNIRELQNVIERAVVLDKDGVLGSDDLPVEISGVHHEDIMLEGFLKHKLKGAINGFEKAFIKQSLEQYKNNVTQTASALGISRRNLQQKMMRYGMKDFDN